MNDIDALFAICPRTVCGRSTILEPERIGGPAITWPCACGYTVTVSGINHIGLKAVKTPAPVRHHDAATPLPIPAGQDRQAA